jgi:hypothetical protein
MIEILAYANDGQSAWLLSKCRFSEAHERPSETALIEHFHRAH